VGAVPPRRGGTPAPRPMHDAVKHDLDTTKPKHSYKNKLHNFGVPERQSYATYFCKDPKGEGA